MPGRCRRLRHVVHDGRVGTAPQVQARYAGPCSPHLHAYRAHGVPKLSADYARRLFTDPHAQRLFGVLILLVGSGSLFGLIPVADAEVAALLAQLCVRLRRNVKTRPLSLKLIAKCEGAVLDGSGRVAGAVLRRCSLFEVTAALVLLLELRDAAAQPHPRAAVLAVPARRCLLERATAGGAAAGRSTRRSSPSTRESSSSWRAFPSWRGRAGSRAGAPGRPPRVQAPAAVLHHVTVLRTNTLRSP